MARPFRLPTYHDPRAQLMARAGQLLHDLLDTLGQLEQLQLAENSSAEAESHDWILEEEGPEGPIQHTISPQLLVEALRSAGPNHAQDTIERVVGDHSDGGSALAALVSCHHDPPHSTPAASAAERTTTTTAAPMSMPPPTTCARQSAQSAQSWHEVGNDLRRLADQLSLDNRLKNTSCNNLQSQSESSVAPAGTNMGLIQSLMALVLPKKLSYSATFVYVGMRLLKYNFKEY